MTEVVNDPFLNPRKEQLVEADGQNMYVPKAGFFDSDNWSAGFGEGQKYTSYSLLSDLGMKLNTVDPADTIDVDDWNETHPYWQDDVTWDQSLTLDVARNIFFTRKESENYFNLQQRSTTGGMVARGISIFGAAAFDPINLVAAPAAVYAKAGIGAKMLWAAGANMLVEGSLMGVAYGTQDVRGQELTTSDIAWNLAAAAGIGAAFPVAGAGLRRLFTAKKVTDIPGDTSTSKVDYTPQQKQKINSQSGHTKQVKFNTVDNIDFSTIDSVKINAKGRLIDDGEGVTVARTEDNIISITGKAEDVVKVLPSLTARLGGFENISLKIDGRQTQVFKNAEEVSKAIKQIEKDTGVKAKLDKPDTILNEVKFKDKGYQIEFDQDGNLTGRVFETTPAGKVRKKPMPENKAQEIIRANQEQIKARRTAINKQVGSPDTNTNSNVGYETVDAKLNYKKNYSTQSQVDASVSGQRKGFIDNHGNTETSFVALINSEVIKARDWFSAGYFINEAGERIDLTQFRFADLTPRERALLTRRLGLSKQNDVPVNSEGFVVPTGRGLELRKRLDRFDSESNKLDNEKTALTDYLNCIRING